MPGFLAFHRIYRPGSFHHRSTIYRPTQISCEENVKSQNSVWAMLLVFIVNAYLKTEACEYNLHDYSGCISV